MPETTLAIANPAAGFGKAAALLPGALEQLRQAGLDLEVVETQYAGHATEIAREAYANGYRRFIAVGGDGTSFEIVNGLFPAALNDEPPTLGFLPLGTGNSFLRDFSKDGATYALQAISAGWERPCDVIKLTHTAGVLYYINILSLGFVADVCVLANERFKKLGEVGYGLAVVSCLARFKKRVLNFKMDGFAEANPPATALLIFNNSKYTGGNMMLAPSADVGDGLIDIVRWSAGRFDFLWNFRKCYDGTHVFHPLIFQGRARRIELDFGGPIDIMIDGEVMNVELQTLEVLPNALRVMV